MKSEKTRKIYIVQGNIYSSGWFIRVILKIRQSQFDASALRFAACSPDYRIQLKNRIYWLAGPINCFGVRGGRYWAIKSWLPACYWVRWHGDGTFFSASISLVSCNCLLPSRLHQSRPVLSIASPNVRLFLLMYFLWIFFFSLSMVPTTAYEPVSFFTNRTCVVHGESRQEIKATNAKERKSESLGIFLHAYPAEIYTMYKIICLK